MQINKNKGFTLIELLIVIGIIAILAAVVIVAINPSSIFDKTGNATRQANVATYMDALSQYQIDNLAWPSDVPVEPTAPGEICALNAASCTGYVDLSDELLEYLAEFPVDPSCPDTTYCTDANGTGFTVQVNSNGRMVVAAPLAAGGETIQIIR